jgi:UDP-glucose 4,6-dehydratase
MNKIFITGGCGFIGSHISEFFFKKYKNAKIFIYDKMTYASHLSNLDNIISSKRVKLIKNDICNYNVLLNSCKNSDLLIHAAAESHVDNSYLVSEEFIKTNVLGTKNVFDACLVNKIKNIIHISTDEVYGEIQNRKFSEENKLNPSNPYSSSKAAGDMLALGYIQSYKLPIKIVRSNNIYGIRQHPEKLIAGFIWCIVNKKKFTLHGNGEHKRTFLHVLDFCKALNVIFKKGKKFEIYNVGSTNEFKNIELIKLICKIININFIHYIKKVPDRIFNDARYGIKLKKIKALRWKPKEKINKSLKEIYLWTQRNSKNFTSR